MIRLEMYGDFWFDNGLELLGYEMSRAGMSVTFREGLKFEKPTSGQIRKFAKLLDERVDEKLFYSRKDENQVMVRKGRSRLPVFHQSAHVAEKKRGVSHSRGVVGFIGLFPDEKEKLLSLVLIPNGSGTERCEICTRLFVSSESNKVVKATQTVYPFITTSLKSCCGVRKMKPEYRACPTCVVAGSMVWVDDLPFFT